MQREEALSARVFATREAKAGRGLFCQVVCCTTDLPTLENQGMQVEARHQLHPDAAGLQIIGCF